MSFRGIDIPIANVPPSGRAAVAGPSRAVVSDITGAAREKEYARATGGGAISQLGGIIGGIGEDLSNKLIADQVLSAEIEHTDSMSKFFVDMDNAKLVDDGIPQWNKAYEQFESRYKQTTEGISERLTPEAKEIYQAYSAAQKQQAYNVLTGKIEALRGNYLATILPLKAARLGRNGQLEKVNEIRDYIEANNLLSESQLRAFDKIVDKNFIAGAMGRGASDETIRGMIKGADSLTVDEKAALSNKWKTISRAQTEWEDQQFEIRKGVELEKIWDSARKAEYSPKMASSFIDGMQYLTPTEKDRELTKYLRISSSITEGKGNPYTHRQDEKAYADMIIRLTNLPGDINEEKQKKLTKEIEDGTGVLWTTIDYKEMQKMLPASYEYDFSLTDPVTKMYKEMLNDLYPDEMTDEERVDYVDKYFKTIQILTENAGDGAKIEKEFQILTKLIRDDKSKDILGRIWRSYKWWVPHEMGKLLFEGEEETVDAKTLKEDYLRGRISLKEYGEGREKLGLFKPPEKEEIDFTKLSIEELKELAR